MYPCITHPAGLPTRKWLTSVGNGTGVFNLNYEFLGIIERNSLTQFSGLAQTLSMYLDILQEFGTYFVLNPGDRFIVRLNDDFTGLISHTFGIKGIEVQ